MADKLDGKVAIVTGAGRGNGKAFAIALASAGAKVVATDLQRAEETAEEITQLGGEALGLQSDVTKLGDIEAMVRQATERFGKIDVLVNNAAIFPAAPFLEKTEAEVENVFAVNLKGVFFCSQYVAKEMVAKEVKGSIINIASNQGIIGVAASMNSDYTATKGGIIAFARAAAAELCPHGIRCNTMALGITRTEGFMGGLPPEVAQVVEAYAKFVPAGRLGVPEDYTGLLVWLASDESSFCTGSTFVVDGGVHSLQPPPPPMPG